MKICAHCATENRAEAIFCSHCRHPLQAAQTPQADSWLKALDWLLLIFLLLGLGAYLFSRGSFPGNTAEQPSGPISDLMPTAGPAPARTGESVALSACVRDRTRIRRGPGTQFETTGGLLYGICLTILGRTEDANWFYMVSDDHQTGWVDASALTIAGDISRVSVRDDSAVANASQATLTSAEIAHGAQAYLTEVAATNIPQSPLTRYVVPCFETASRIGEHISCRMERAVCNYLPLEDGGLTVCSDRPYPDYNFVLNVFGEDWTEYDGHCIIVSGYLEIDQGRLQIWASGRSQVAYCN